MGSIHKNESVKEDARDMLLRYAKEAEEKPEFVGPAYQLTQPKAIFGENQPTKDNIKYLE